MKKIISILLTLVILFSALPVAFAGKNYEATEIELTDYFTKKTKSYQTINMMMGGENLVTKDVPGILYTENGASRTMVPI